jgi:hypothetical protein
MFRRRDLSEQLQHTAFACRLPDNKPTRSRQRYDNERGIVEDSGKELGGFRLKEDLRDA